MTENEHSSADTTHTAADDARIEARLNHIDHCIAKIAEHQNVPLIEEEGPQKKANKLVVATAFGFAGLKLGGFTLGKFGFAADIVNAYRRDKFEGLKEVVHSLFNMADKEKGAAKNIPYMVATATIGATAGTIGGVLLGLSRGDRLKSSGDLFMHPIDSMKKIFGSKPLPPVTATKVEVTAEPSQEVKVTVKTEPPAIVSPAQHEGTVSASPEVQLAH